MFSTSGYVKAYFFVKNVLKEEMSVIWHKNKKLDHFDCIILPGGFSYGDYLRTGSIARFAPIMNALFEYAKKGGLLLGICNGFQILTEMKLLPGAILMNKSLKFICKQVNLKVVNNNIPFTQKIKKGNVLKIPIAHLEGNYFISKNGLENLKKNNRIVFKYSDENGQITNSANPNGSMENIAGICNEKGNILGLMPHPERAMENILGSQSGRIIFESIVDFVRSKNV